MASANKKKVYYTSPRGIAVFPALTEPDTKGEYAKGGYKVDLEITKEDYLREKPKLDEIIKQVSGGKKQQHAIIFEGDPKKERTKGRYYIRFKSVHQPEFYDVTGQVQIDPKKDKKFKVWGGSIIKCKASAYAHLKGVSLGLNAVQVIKLAGRANGFEAEEGEFAYEGPSEDSSDETEATHEADDEVDI